MRPLLPLLFFLGACELKLPDGWPHDGGADDAGPDAGPRRFIDFNRADGGVTLVIDAMDNTRWAAIDLDIPEEVPFEAHAWDLSFQRFHVRARGGASGDGGVQIAVVSDAGYDAVARAPGGPWLEDAADGPDDNMDLDTVFDAQATWYDYDLAFHTLTPKPFVFVVRTDTGGFFKLQIDGYYDRAGTPAVIRLRFAPVLPP